MKSRFKVGDEVAFTFKTRDASYELTGWIEIVDYGTFENPGKISYDILVEHSPFHNGEACLFKHILEEGLES